MATASLSTEPCRQSRVARRTATVASPQECLARLRELGYRGQERAARAASVLLYRHVRRVERLAVGESVPFHRTNYLFMGPTG